MPSIRVLVGALSLPGRESVGEGGLIQVPDEDVPVARQAVNAGSAEWVEAPAPEEPFTAPEAPETPPAKGRKGG